MLSTKIDYAYDVFVSYSSCDRDWVRTILLPRLESPGLRVWIDYRDALPGALVVREIEKAIAASRRIVLVISRAYLQSVWTEFERALVQTGDPAARDQRLVPMLIESCSLPLSLSSLIHVNLTKPTDDPEEWEKLLRVLCAKALDSHLSPPLQPQDKLRPTAMSDNSEAGRLVSCVLALFANEEELREFCFASFPEVYRNLRETDRLPYIARTLIDYCRTRGRTNHLWSKMRARNAQAVDTILRKTNDPARGAH